MPDSDQNTCPRTGEFIDRHRYLRIRFTYPNGHQSVMHWPALVKSEDAETIDWVFGYAAIRKAKIRGLDMVMWGTPQGKDEDEVLFAVPIPADLFAAEDYLQGDDS